MKLPKLYLFWHRPLLSQTRRSLANLSKPCCRRRYFGYLIGQKRKAYLYRISQLHSLECTVLRLNLPCAAKQTNSRYGYEQSIEFWEYWKVVGMPVASEHVDQPCSCRKPNEIKERRLYSRAKSGLQFSCVPEGAL